MNVQIVVFKHIRLIREEALHKAHRNLRGFLHDIAELSGDNEFSLALREQSLNIEDFSADLRPGKSCDNTRLRILKNTVMVNRMHIKDFTEHILCHRNRLHILAYDKFMLFGARICRLCGCPGCS